MNGLQSTGAALALSLMALAAHAQYPAKPIHIVVPSAPGDGSDLTARID